jgi:ubiquitin C-terminal hydrolase
LIFLLDGLHEDLNKISIKPYKEISEKGDDEDDETAAKRFWDLHLMRNDSVIVDLFHGQYRSTITCPECHRVSITYDPFTTVPVPVPNLKKLDVYFVPQFNVKKTLKLSLFISQDALFYDIAHYIDNAIGEKIGKFRCMIVAKNECVKMVKASDNILEAASKGYIFCCEVDPKLLKTEYTNLIINLRDGIKNEYKSYPRIFTVSNSMTLKDLRLVIYGFMRRFIDLPDSLNNHLESRYEKILEAFSQNNSGSYEDYENIIKEEFNFLFDFKLENDELNKVRDSFVSSLPYEFYVINPKDGSKKILFSPNVNKQFEDLKLENSEESSKSNLSEILSENTSIKDIIEFVKEGYKINIEFTSNDHINSDKIKILQTCINYASKDKDKKLNLFDCLEHFRLTEKLGKNNEWYCKDCKKHQRAYKKLELFYTPPLLVLHLKRFSYSSMGRYRTYADKIGTVIDFPLNDLDISPYIIGPDSSKAVYELYAVSQHYGSCMGGHYTAICKNNGKWYDFNDSSVSPSNESNVVTSAAYLLFYRRKDNI